MIGPKIKNNSNDEFIIQDNNIAINKSSNNSNNDNNKLPFNMPPNYQVLIKSDYKGITLSPIFYESFTQTSYWERQEIKTKLQNIDDYYIVVVNDDVYNGNNNSKISRVNKNNNEGKFSLAVGEVEGSSLQDFFILLPYTWIKVNLFFNDYLRTFIAAIIFVFIIIVLPIMMIYIRKRRKKIIR